MRLQSNGNHVGDTLLIQFVSDFGAPDHVAFDGAAVHTPKTRFMRAIRKYD
jgi:hypothetical protein